MGSEPAILYSTERRIDAEAFADLLRRSTLSERRPVDDLECLAGMVEGADLMVTAWAGDLLVGVSRSVTDFHYACYLSDLAVDDAFQRRGIGRQLIHRTQQALGPRCTLILLAAPAARAYYPRLGFDAHGSCWTLPRERSVRAGVAPTASPKTLSPRSVSPSTDQETPDE